MKSLQKEALSGRTVQLLFLLAAASVIFLFVPLDFLFPGMGYFAAEKYLAVPCLLFFGSALTQRLSAPAKRSLLLSAVAVIWFAAAQLQHHLAQMGTSSFGVFAVVYLLAFPFAAVTEDQKKNHGMKWVGWIYITASLLLVSSAVLLLLDAVPEVLASGIYWDGTRLYALWHPNISACAFMLGIGFTVYFLIQAEKTWKKAILAALAVLQFLAMALTNSRTSIFLTCGLLGGIVFCAIWKGGWKRLLAAAAAAMAVTVSLFILSSSIFEFQSEIQLQTVLRQHQEAEENLVDDIRPLEIDGRTGELRIATSSGQGSLRDDIWTLNNRTYTWDATITAIRDNPTIRKWGTENVSMEISYRNLFNVGHAHNSWLQTAMKLGIPGLLVALAYTAIACFRCLAILWRQDFDLSKKLIAILVLCTMAAGILEPYLFTGDIFTLFVNFIFFFCTGYLDVWCSHSTGKTA